MYVTATSPRFSRGRSTPATRAILVLRSSRLWGYPCRCLCRGFLQMMRVTPCRLMILQCSHRVLTDGRTFMALLLEPVGDPAPRQIVGRQLDLHPVARQDPDEVHPHLAADVGQHPVAALELHAKHRVRQRFHHRSLYFDRVFFWHPPLSQAAPWEAPPFWPVSTPGPVSVMAMVCSKWAA